MLKVGVMISGSGISFRAILDAVGNGSIRNAEVEMAISNDRSAYTLERARNHGIQTVYMSLKEYESREAFNETLLQKVDEFQLDLIVLAGFLAAIPEVMAKKYEKRIINTHPSLIPSFCGVGYYDLKVHEATLAHGVKVTGATIHYVDSGMDTGPIVLQEAVEVQEGDIPETLQHRVMEQAKWVILPQAIDMVANRT